MKPRKKEAQDSPTNKEGSPFPMRINQYLAKEGHSTRRGADDLIKKGLVLINGRRAVVGDRVSETDKVEVRFRQPKTYVYLAFHKPAGMDTHEEKTGSPDVLSSLPSDLRRLNLFPVGRLDKPSRGLMLLTNDGRVTDRLLNPKYAHEKVYEVTTKKPLRETAKEKLEKGVDIEGYRTKPARVTILAENRFRITLTEGKTHQVRRMVVAIFNEVSDLKRTSMMDIKLAPLKPGAYRRIEGEELTSFLRSLGLS